MSEKKQLKEEQLKDVNGGYFEPTNNVFAYGTYIDKYDVGAYIGQQIYFARNNEGIKATIIDSYEDKPGCGSVRTHKVTVNEIINYCSDLSKNQTCEISGDEWTAYTSLRVKQIFNN